MIARSVKAPLDVSQGIAEAAWQLGGDGDRKELGSGRHQENVRQASISRQVLGERAIG